MDDNIRKPLSVARVDFINDISNLINSCCLPPFVIEMIVRDMYVDIKRIADKQYESDLSSYNQIISEVGKEE